MAGWTCQRQTAGKVCKHKNTGRARKCGVCGKSRPPRRRPAHLAALDIPYERYIEINGGERCGICGRAPTHCANCGGSGRSELPDSGDCADGPCGFCHGSGVTRRLDRDHDHKTGRPRGLLCRTCNRRLTQRVVNNDWILKAVAYLARPAP